MKRRRLPSLLSMDRPHVKIVIDQHAAKAAIMAASSGIAAAAKCGEAEGNSARARALAAALASVRIDADTDGVAVFCSGGNVAIRARIDGTVVEGTGSLAVSASKLLALISAFPEKRLDHADRRWHRHRRQFAL